MLGLCLTLIDSPNDREKFEQIFYEYKDMMTAIAMSVLHNRTLADEAVQDSFLKIAKNIFKIDDVHSYKTKSFIAIIVRNVSLTNLKKESADNIVPYDDIKIANLSMPDIEAVFINIGFNGVVKAIDSMDKIYSDVLKLKYIYGYSNKQLAEILEITPKNVEMRIFRGKQLLKNKLEDNGYAVK